MATPISRYTPNANTGDRTEFTDKRDLLEIPLVITNARTAKGKQGVFWIIEAARQDTGEHIVFTGSTVIDQMMVAVKESNGFPVAAMLVQVQPEDPAANWYWNLIDPPGMPDSNGEGRGGRVAEVGVFIDKGVVDVEGVQKMCEKIAGAPAKVNDLDDDQYERLLDRLRERATDAPPSSDPPPEEPPF